MNENNVRELLYQVCAENTQTGQLMVIPCFPKVSKTAATILADTVANMIACGKEKRFANPRALPIL